MGMRSEMGAYTYLGALEHERVAAEDGGHENLELHVREVLTHACPIVHNNCVVSFLVSGTSSFIISLTLGRTRTD